MQFLFIYNMVLYIQHCHIMQSPCMLLRRRAFMRFWHGKGHRFPEWYSSVLSLVFPGRHVVVQLFHFVTNTCNYAALCLTINSRLSDLFYGEVGKFIFACYFERVGLFICYYHVPLKNFSHLWRCHNYQWRTSNFDLCSALIAIEQWGFLSVPHLQ